MSSRFFQLKINIIIKYTIIKYIYHEIYIYTEYNSYQYSYIYS